MVCEAFQALVYAAQQRLCAGVDAALRYDRNRGWRMFIRDPLGATMIVWAVALALNFIWSPIFFRLHRPAAALFVILALLAMITAFIALSWPEDALSALLFAPYAVWVVFATILNASIWRLNG